MEEDITLSEEFSEIFKKYNCKGYAWAVIRENTGLPEVGYGASYPTGTEQELIKKLKIMIHDIEKSCKGKI